MGVQSLDPRLLERLGRIHSRAMVFNSFDILRHAGFENVNLDLMLAIPGQTLEVWRQTLDEAMALGSEHLSAYEIIYEEDTPLYAQLRRANLTWTKTWRAPCTRNWSSAPRRPASRRYEIANFARPSLACQHNLNYWRAGSFYGVGPSATSYVRGARTKNWSNTQLYCELIEAGRGAVESREELVPLARAGEAAAFGLRMVAGWPFDDFRRRTGQDLRGEWAADMSRLVEQGWGRLSPDRFQLHPRRPAVRRCRRADVSAVAGRGARMDVKRQKGLIKDAMSRKVAL